MVKRWVQMLLTIVVAIGLTLGLTACGDNRPGNQVVERAIALQVAQVQTAISQQLKLKPPTLKDIRIQHLQIEQQSGVPIEQEPGYHLSGHYDLTLRQSDHQATQADDRFDLYLQRHTEGVGKTQKQVWRLAAPTDGKGWTTQAID
jgi:hypothetical protein